MVISKTPLRISLIGGGTDFRDVYQHIKGQVIATTIDKYIYVIVKERFDKKIVLHYTSNEIVERVSEIRHDLIREAMKMVGIMNSIEIITLADIPSSGSGLGSSSCVTVGLLNALYNYKGVQMSSEELAARACNIEIDILKKPIGEQDQYICACGGLKKIVFKTSRSHEIHSYNLLPNNRRIIGSNLLLHYTNVTRSSDKILKNQVINTNNNKKNLIAISQIVDILDESIKEKKYEMIGKSLKINWLNKKKLSKKISNPKIDYMVDTAMKNGALGCKIAGAGGGGFLLSYVPRNIQDKFRNSMRDYYEMPFMLDPHGTRIVLNII